MRDNFIIFILWEALYKYWDMIQKASDFKRCVDTSESFLNSNKLLIPVRIEVPGRTFLLNIFIYLSFGIH